VVHLISYVLISYLRVKRLERQADRQRRSDVQVNVQSSPFTTQYVFMAVCLIKDKRLPFVIVCFFERLINVKVDLSFV
jgi:hypothetical protein